MWISFVDRFLVASNRYFLAIQLIRRAPKKLDIKPAKHFDQLCHTRIGRRFPIRAISSARVNAYISKEVTSGAITQSAGCTSTVFML